MPRPTVYKIEQNCKVVDGTLVYYYLVLEQTSGGWLPLILLNSLADAERYILREERRRNALEPK